MTETEIYCSSYGKNINSETEICPHHGVRQIKNAHQASYDSDLYIYKLQKLTGKKQTIAVILGLLITMLGFVYVGKWGLAIVNFITIKYLLLRITAVPMHTNSLEDFNKHEISTNCLYALYMQSEKKWVLSKFSMTSNARKKLDAIGVGY
jgi:hypothetical protein